MAAFTPAALIQDSLRELGVLAQGQPLDDNDAAFGLGRLNQIFDNWNADRQAVWVEEFHEFAFVADQQDYTIGPSGADFTVANARPVVIDNANVLLDNVDPVVSNPINIRDYQWWANLTVRAVTTTFPTDLYYAPDWPNGTLHFWPKPTTAYGLELVCRVTIGAATIQQTVTVPSGYQNALMLTLAEDLAPAYGRSLLAKTEQKAREARARIFANNTIVPTLVTVDAGMPRGGRNRSAFNYRTGLNMVVTR